MIQVLNNLVSNALRYTPAARLGSNRALAREWPSQSRCQPSRATPKAASRPVHSCKEGLFGG
jgi:hypothetical protein